MDWIEKVFGVSPDGGDGAAEMAIVLAATIIVAAAIARLPVIRAIRQWLKHKTN